MNRTIMRNARQHRYSNVGLVDRKFYSKRPLRDADKKPTIASDEDLDLDLSALTEEEVASLKEIIPFIPALKKIAKGEFEIERVEEDTDSDENEEVSEDTDFEEDTDFSEDTDADTDVEEDVDADVEDEPVEDAIDKVWAKRLAGKETK